MKTLMNNDKNVHKHMENLQKEIDRCVHDAGKFASEYVEYFARKNLENHPELHEFVMGMGTYFFIRKDGETLDQFSFKSRNLNDETVNKLADFINQWDCTLKITGEPMRFTATGKINRNW